MKHTSPYIQAAALGIIAGMRAMMAPAFASVLLDKYPDDPYDKSFNWLRSKTASRFTALLAGLELVGDKLPSAPNRTEVGGVVGRCVAGGLSGAAICKVRAAQPIAGALIGAGAAAASTYACFYVRKTLTDRQHISNALAGTAEDGIAIASGLALLLT